MKKILTTLILFSACGLVVHADTQSSKGSFYYAFHLYFNGATLVTDRDFKFSYDVIPGSYTAPVLKTGFPYRGEIVNFAGETSATFTFDPRNGDASFNAGKISVNAPYVADGQKAVFYNPQNQAVLSVSVDTSSYCNDDGICNADRGEDYTTCPKDCRAATLPVPSTTVTPAAQSAAGASGLTIGILFLLIGVVFLGGFWWFFKRRSSGGNGPLVPPPSLPTPPTPPNTSNPV